jgi:cell pole-organizing protein PopZ
VVVKNAGEGVDDVGLDMTQPAKVQEPSMEEILASIRRIIADDEAKPAIAEKPVAVETSKKPELARAEPPKAAAPQPVAPVTKAPVMSNISPSATPAARAAPAPAPRPAPPPPPAAMNSQDDIDAMLAGLDAATSEPEIRPPSPPPEEEVFELTDDMVMPAPPPNVFRKVEPEEDLEFAEAVTASERQRKPVFDPPSYDSSPFPPTQPILSRSTVSAVESAFNSLANTVLSNNARTLEDLVKEMLRPMLKSWLDDNLPGLVERIVKAEIERVSRGRQ